MNFSSFSLFPPFTLFLFFLSAPPVSDSFSTRSHPSDSVWTFVHFWCSLYLLRECLSHVSTTHVCEDFSCGVKGQKFFERDTLISLSNHMASNSKRTVMTCWIPRPTNFNGSKVCRRFVWVSLNNNQSCMFIYFFIIYLFHLSYLCYHTMCPHLGSSCSTLQVHLSSMSFCVHSFCFVLPSFPSLFPSGLWSGCYIEKQKVTMECWETGISFEK